MFGRPANAELVGGVTPTGAINQLGEIMINNGGKQQQRDQGFFPVNPVPREMGINLKWIADGVCIVHSPMSSSKPYCRAFVACAMFLTDDRRGAGNDRTVG
eukprot:8015233-Lingulodinium_polyedra.AAC.1